MWILNNQLNKAYGIYNIHFEYNNKHKLNHRDIEKIWWYKPRSKQHLVITSISDDRYIVMKYCAYNNIWIRFYKDLFSLIDYIGQNCCDEMIKPLLSDINDDNFKSDVIEDIKYVSDAYYDDENYLFNMM